MLYEAEAGNLTLVASGDTMITRKLSVFREERYRQLLDIFRTADIGFTNLEVLMHDFEHSPGGSRWNLYRFGPEKISMRSNGRA